MERRHGKSPRGLIARPFRAPAGANGMHRRSTAIGGGESEYSITSSTLGGSSTIGNAS